MEKIISQQSLENQQLSQVASNLVVPAILSGMVVMGVASVDFAKPPNSIEKASGVALVILCATIAGSIKKHEQFCLDEKLPIISWDENNKQWNTTITVENFAVAAERRENLLNQQRLLHGGAVVSLVVGVTMAQPVLGAAAVLSVLGGVAGRRQYDLNKELTKAARHIPEVLPGDGISGENPCGLTHVQCVKLNNVLRTYRL
jgi:hypothetical protein